MGTFRPFALSQAVRDRSLNAIGGSNEFPGRCDHDFKDDRCWRCGFRRSPQEENLAPVPWVVPAAFVSEAYHPSPLADVVESFTPGGGSFGGGGASDSWSDSGSSSSSSDSGGSSDSGSSGSSSD